MKKSKTKDTFVRAIEIIAEIKNNPENLDVVGFLLQLAMRNPDHLVSAYEETFSQLKRRLLELLWEERKIQAIKLYREEAKVGLKEAKDYIDALIVQYKIPLSPYQRYN